MTNNTLLPNSSLSPRVGVIVLNWNGLSDTLECLNSLRETTYKNHIVTVVDNGSTDKSAELIPTRFPDIKFISTGENLGWAGGNNIGITDALAVGCDYIFLLNNDTIVEPNCIQFLVDASNIVGPSLMHPAIYYFDEPDVAQLDPTEGTSNACNKNHPIRLEYAYGAALFIHASVFRKVGLLDERFFLQLEETDYFLRAKKVGINTFCAPNAKVLHKESRSFGGRSTPMKTYYIVRNTLLIISKHPQDCGGYLSGLKKFLWTLNGIISRKKEKPQQWRLEDLLWIASSHPEARAIRHGLIDFLFDSFGKSRNIF